MVKLVSARCSSCGASLKLSKEEEIVKCEYCHQTIIVDEAIACYKLKISGTVNIDGIESNAELITAANELLDMNEYLKAKRKFLEFSEKNPNNYQGWLGLLICRTRNFTIKDNNIMFENDINKFYEHFLRVAPEDIKKEYKETIENYLHPKVEQQVKETYNKAKEKSNFKINPKYKPFIAPIIFCLCGLALLSNSIIIGGILWSIAGILLIPEVKEKLKISKNISIILSILLGIAGFIAFGIESPYGYIGKWDSSNNLYSIEFKEDNTFIIIDENNNTIKGEYTHKYENDIYTITINTDNELYNNQKYEYDSSKGYSKMLCLYENDSCSVYFKKNSDN